MGDTRPKVVPWGQIQKASAGIPAAQPPSSPVTAAQPPETPIPAPQPPSILGSQPPSLPAAQGPTLPASQPAALSRALSYREELQYPSRQKIKKQWRLSPEVVRAIELRAVELRVAEGDIVESVLRQALGLELGSQPPRGPAAQGPTHDHDLVMISDDDESLVVFCRLAGKAKPTAKDKAARAEVAHLHPAIVLEGVRRTFANAQRAGIPVNGFRYCLPEIKATAQGREVEDHRPAGIPAAQPSSVPDVRYDVPTLRALARSLDDIERAREVAREAGTPEHVIREALG